MSCSTWLGIVIIGTIILTVSCNSSKAEIFDNRGEKNDVSAIKRPSFFVGSRYGRSQYGIAPQHNLNVVPRNDRFFLGSRYGKRSDENMQDVVDQEPSKEYKKLTQGGYFVSCSYTGVKDFYRCHKLRDNASESSSEEQQSFSSNGIVPAINE